jgi:hypothetical protein
MRYGSPAALAVDLRESLWVRAEIFNALNGLGRPRAVGDDGSGLWTAVENQAALAFAPDA